MKIRPFLPNRENAMSDASMFDPARVPEVVHEPLKAIRAALLQAQSALRVQGVKNHGARKAMHAISEGFKALGDLYLRLMPDQVDVDEPAKPSASRKSSKG
jgi:hypothetical protein